MPLSVRVLVALGMSLPLTGCAPAVRRQVVNPPGLAAWVPAYSVAIRSGDMVFLSGMTGIKPGTQDVIDGGVAVQTRQALENIRDEISQEMHRDCDPKVSLVDVDTRKNRARQHRNDNSRLTLAVM